MASSRIADLAAIIQINTSKVDQYLSSVGMPAPSFDVEAPLALTLPADIAACRGAILEATDELNSLMLGPIELLNWQAAHGSASLQAIYRFGIASSFPVGETATFSQIATTCRMNESEIQRILRNSMTGHIFKELDNGLIAHTAATKALVQVPLLNQWIGMVLEEIWPSSTRIVDALVRWPGSQEPEHSGFALAHSVQESIFRELKKQPDRAKRFNEAMSFFQSTPGLEPIHVVKSYDWGMIGNGNGTIVDVGGSHGLVSIELAKRFPSLCFVVQDLPEVIADVSKTLPKDLSKQVTFVAHDFFADQTLQNVDVFFFRWIFHNWSDKYCILILRALIPALKPSTRILINDFCLPKPGTMSYYQEKMMRGFDMAMMGLQNSKERDPSDWLQLLEDADPRFRLIGINTPIQSRLALIEIAWDVSKSDTE